MTAQSGTAEWTGLHITSTDSIALYAALQGNNSLDVTVILPTIALGTDYRVQSFPSASTGVFRTSFLVVAVDTGTTVVDITPSAPTLNGFSANITQTFNLQQGQVCQLRGAQSPGGDLTNSTVQVRNNKRVAVFSGHYCAVIPNPNATSSCDYLFDQSLPTNLWGTDFVIPSTRSNTPNHVRVLSLHDNCIINKNGSYVATRNTGEIYSFSLSASEDRTYLHTSTPVSVCLFMASEGNNGVGDPSMVSIPPAGQFIKNITFSSRSFRNTMTHYVRVITRASDTGNVYIDGVSMSGLFLSVPGTSEYVVAYKNITEGAHTINAAGGDGFSAMIYGRRNRESYATFVGTDISPRANGRLLYNGTIVNRIDCCKGDTSIAIQAESSIPYDSVVWFLDSTRLSAGNNYHFTTTDTGCFSLTASFHFPATMSCLDSSQIYRSLQLCVHNSYEQEIFDTVHYTNLPVHFAGRTYNDEVDHDTIREQTVHNCDSIIIYSLHVIREDTIYIAYHDTICVGVPYTGHGFYIEADSIVGTTTHIHRDSFYVYTLRLTRINLSYEQEIFDTVHYTNLPVHFAGRTYYDEVDHDTIHEQTLYHCDSIIIYSLHVIRDDSVYETYHDTICIGVPYTGHGFYIEADSIIGTTTHIRRDSLYVHTLYLTRVDHPTLSISYNYVNRGYHSLTANTSAPYILWTSIPPDPELTEEMSRNQTIQIKPKKGTVYHVHACHDPWGGCCSDDSILIPLEHNFALWVPNVFTPENDINNLFKVIGQEITDFEIYIYYRWGTIAYHSTDINEGWDGTHNGGKCPQGSYAYIIFYKDETSIKNRQVKIGTVTLLR